MKKICPKCDNKEIEVASTGDCAQCGVHKTWICSKCQIYFDKPKVIPSLVYKDGDDFYTT